MKKYELDRSQIKTVFGKQYIELSTLLIFQAGVLTQVIMEVGSNLNPT